MCGLTDVVSGVEATTCTKVVAVKGSETQGLLFFLYQQRESSRESPEQTKGE
jgi:hypothetical protein